MSQSKYTIVGRAKPSYKIVGRAEEYNEPTEDDQPEEEFSSKLPRNIMSGLAGIGHNAMNLPHDIMYGAESLGSSIGDRLAALLQMPKESDLPFLKSQYKNPENVQHIISDMIPHQEEKNFAQMLGQKGVGTFSDNAIQMGIKYAPEILGLTGLIRHGLKHLPITQYGAANKLRQADKLISKVGAKTPLSEETIEAATPFLPKTHATREMLEKARAGDYKSTFATQSQIGHHERNLRKSTLASERLLAPEARELKQIALSEAETALRGQGHHEAADLIRGGIDTYRKYIKIRDNVFPILRKIGIPTTALGLFGVGVNKAIKSIKD